MDQEQKGGENQGQGKKCCHGHGCRCGFKIVGAIALVLLGWICGYLMGSGGLCGHKSMMGACPMTSAPQSPQQK